MTKEAFHDFAHFHLSFFKYNIEMQSHKEGLIIHEDVNKELLVTLSVPRTDVVFLSNVHGHKRLTLCQRNPDTALIDIRCRFPQPGEYELEIYASKKPDYSVEVPEKPYDVILEYRVIVEGSAVDGVFEEFPSIYGDLASREHFLHYPLEYYFLEGEKVHFKVSAGTATEMAARHQGKRIQFHKRGDCFEGEVLIGEGVVLIMGLYYEKGFEHKGQKFRKVLKYNKPPKEAEVDLDDVISENL